MERENIDIHDRTHLLAGLVGVDRASLAALLPRRIALEVTAEAAATVPGRLAFLTVCNLAARLGPYAPHLAIEVPAAARPLKSRSYRESESLALQAAHLLRAVIAPEGLVRGFANSAETHDLAIVIGRSGRVRARRVLYVGWSEWLGVISEGSYDVPMDPSGNPFGPLVAAGMAVGWLHRAQLSVMGASFPATPPRLSLNALTLSDAADGPRALPRGIRVPRTLLIGAGALGSAFCYSMSHVPDLETTVDVLDADILTGTNSNRQLTATFDRAISGTELKVEDVAKAWSAVQPFPMTYEQFKAHHGRSANDYEIAVTAVDNIAARRAVALDLPRVLVDGATGGLMAALSRGADPAQSCVACTYADILTDEDGLWSKRLGVAREFVTKLREGNANFDASTLDQIRRHGTLFLDEEVETGLRREGWAFLERARCGNAKPDRDLPVASVSYVSALCGFLMAAQAVAEAMGHSALVRSPRWMWSDLLSAPSEAAEFGEHDVSGDCASRHQTRSRIYRRKWL